MRSFEFKDRGRQASNEADVFCCPFWDESNQTVANVGATVGRARSRDQAADKPGQPNIVVDDPKAAAGKAMPGPPAVKSLPMGRSSPQKALDFPYKLA